MMTWLVYVFLIVMLTDRQLPWTLTSISCKSQYPFVATCQIFNWIRISKDHIVFYNIRNNWKSFPQSLPTSAGVRNRSTWLRHQVGYPRGPTPRCEPKCRGLNSVNMWKNVENILLLYFLFWFFFIVCTYLSIGYKSEAPMIFPLRE